MLLGLFASLFLSFQTQIAQSAEERISENVRNELLTYASNVVKNWSDEMQDVPFGHAVEWFSILQTMSKSTDEDMQRALHRQAAYLSKNPHKRKTYNAKIKSILVKFAGIIGICGNELKLQYFTILINGLSRKADEKLFEAHSGR